MNLASQLEVFVWNKGNLAIGHALKEGDPCSGCSLLLLDEVFIAKIRNGKDFNLFRLCPDCLEFLICPSTPGVQ